MQQCLRAGVPIIASGVGQDKLHTGGIINYVGNGIYNAVAHASPEILTDALNEILRNGTYKYVARRRAMVSASDLRCRAVAKTIAKEYPKYNVLRIVDETIQQVLKGEPVPKPGNVAYPVSSTGAKTTSSSSWSCVKRSRSDDRC